MVYFLKCLTKCKYKLLIFGKWWCKTNTSSYFITLFETNVTRQHDNHQFHWAWKLLFYDHYLKTASILIKCNFQLVNMCMWQSHKFLKFQIIQFRLLYSRCSSDSSNSDSLYLMIGKCILLSNNFLATAVIKCCYPVAYVL